jgi:hypothetical protein
MYAIGDTLYQAYGDQTNIKITTKEDLDMFEGYVLHSRRAGYISDESDCSYDDLWNKVNTRVHLQENCDKWNYLNVSVFLKPEEETLKTLMNEFFAKKNQKMFVRLMQELDFQGWS